MYTIVFITKTIKRIFRYFETNDHDSFQFTEHVTYGVMYRTENKTFGDDDNGKVLTDWHKFLNAAVYIFNSIKEQNTFWHEP